MSTSKATNKEGFQAELFKHVLHALDDHLVDLFNHVFHTCFPLTLSHHTIHLIDKSGSNIDPNNYKNIMIGHMFSKLYATALHLMLSKEFEWRHPRAR